MKKTFPDFIESRFRKFARMGYKGVLLLVAGLIVATYLFVTSPPIIEKIIISQFSNYTTGTISLKVKKASLFRGFVFEDIVIKSGANFEGRTLFEMKRLNLLYSLFGIFVGDIGLHELGLYQPRLSLYEKAGVWNLAALLKPGKEQEEPEKETETTDEISLPVSIRFFLKFVIEDFEVSIDQDTRKLGRIYAGAKNFTFKTHILTKKFNTIPLDISALKIFETFQAHLDPQKKIDFYLVNPNAQAKGPMELHWLFSYDGEKKKPGFISRLAVGHNNIPVTYQDKEDLAFHFTFDYKTDYNPATDVLSLNYLKVSFMGDTWFNFGGTIKHPNDAKNMRVDLSLKDDSNIQLGKLYKLYHDFTEDKDLLFEGNISLDQLKINGPLSTLNTKGAVKFNNIKFRTHRRKKIHELPYFHLNYEALFNNNRQNPLIHSAVSWKGKLNGAKLTAKAIYRSEQMIDLLATVKGFNPAPFIDDMVDGNFNMKFELSGKNERDLKSTLQIDSKKFFYTYSNDRSKENRLDLNLKTTIKTNAGYDKITTTIDKFNVNLKNKKGLQAARLQIGQKTASKPTKIIKTPEKIITNLHLIDFSVNPRQLYPTLTASFKELIKEYAENMEKNVTLKGKTTLVMNSGDYSLASLSSFSNTTDITVEDYDIKDIKFNASIQQKSGKITIDHITLDGLNKALDLDIKGNAKLSRKTDPGDPQSKTWKLDKPDIDVDFKLGKENKEIRMFQGQDIKGAIILDMDIKNDLTRGEFDIKEFHYDNGNFFRINNANMNFDFKHDQALDKVISLKGADSESYTNLYKLEIDRCKSMDPEVRNPKKQNAKNQNKIGCLTIDSIEIPNPNNKKEPKKLIYPKRKNKLGKDDKSPTCFTQNKDDQTGENAPGISAARNKNNQPAEDTQPGLFAAMKYEDNIFSIPALEIHMLKGYIFVPKTRFNLGRLKLSEMEYTSEVRGCIDLKEMIPVERAKSLDDGTIIFAVELEGHNLKQPIANADWKFNTRHIGEEFGRLVLRIARPKTRDFVEKAVKDSVTVQRVHVDLTDGQLDFTVTTKPGMVSINKNNKIEQYKLSISEFLQRFEEETQIYQVASEKEKVKLEE